MKCDIIIPVWNEIELTRACIDSIKKHTNLPYRIIVIDNASGCKTQTFLKELSEKGDISLIQNKENLGFPKAVNQGIGFSDSPYICFLNNDTEVYEGWLTEMVQIAESHPDIGIVNPNSNNLGQKEYLSCFSGKWIEMAACIGFCMLIKREVIEKIGHLDEIYSPGNFEDTDFSKRAVKAGYKCVMAKGAYVYHKENTSFKKRNDWDERFNKNRTIFHERWGKPKRIVCILTNINPNSIKGQIDSFLKNGDWVWVLLNNKLEKLDIREHASLSVFTLKKYSFIIKALWRVLKRKKRFDEIITDSKFFFKIFKVFSYQVRLL